jgi:hypothetical protein
MHRKVDILRKHLFVRAAFYIAMYWPNKTSFWAAFYIAMYWPNKTSFYQAALLNSMYQARKVSGYVYLS